MPGPPARVVLDTNAWLDLLVFDDPRMRPVAAARAAGEVEFLMGDHGRHELQRVLAYPVLRLDADAAIAILARAREAARPVPDPAARTDVPRCRDPDDQPFLDLAVAAGARWLLTRDAELLRLAGRMRARHGVDVLRPEDWRPDGAPQISKR